MRKYKGILALLLAVILTVTTVSVDTHAAGKDDVDWSGISEEALSEENEDSAVQEEEPEASLGSDEENPEVIEDVETEVLQDGEDLTDNNEDQEREENDDSEKADSSEKSQSEEADQQDYGESLKNKEEMSATETENIKETADSDQVSGDENSVTEIETIEDLKRISENLAGDYILTEDIDLSDEEHVPIGDNKEPFTGTFDGDGHVISNLHITAEESEESSFLGLFGVLEDAAVRNVAIVDCHMVSETTGGIYAGAVSGKMKNSSVEDVYVSGQVDVEVETALSVGGISGAVFQDEGDTIRDLEYNIARCVSDLKISVPENAEGEYGSLAGYVENIALVENSYALVQDEELFGIELEEINGCKVLDDQIRAEESNYIQFDFENTWKMTDGGARLITQEYENTESAELEEDASQESDTESDSSQTPEDSEETEDSGAETGDVQKLDTENGSVLEPGESESSEDPDADNDLVEGEEDADSESESPQTLESSDKTETSDSESSQKPEDTGAESDLSQDTGETEKPEPTDTDQDIPEESEETQNPDMEISDSNAVSEENRSEEEILEETGEQDLMVAADTASGEYTYTLSGNDATITGYTGSSTYLVIPDTIDGHNVTGIGDYAFDGDSELTTITLPSKLEKMGYYAFRGTNIRSITIPKTVTSCRYSSGFLESSSDGPLSGASQLKEVIFEEGMTKIPAYILASQSNISYVTKVVIPESVTSVGKYAFYGCDSIKVVDLPQKLEKIESNAFSRSGLQTIAFSESLTGIEHNAFFGCASLTTVNFTENTANGYTAWVGSSCFRNCTSLTDVNFSSNVIHIEDSAFEGDSELTTVILPSKLKSIGDHAFQGTYISSITIPKTVTNCGHISSDKDGPFSGASQLKEVIFEEGMTKVPDYVLASAGNTSYVTKVVIPESVTSIGEYAFYSCDSIKIVDLPKKLEKIESYAFTDSGLQSVALSESLTEIGFSAFSECVSLATVNFSSNVINIGGYAFDGDSAITTITLPSKLESIGCYAFRGTCISSISIPKTVTGCDYNWGRNYDGPFSGALQLKEVIFEEGMTKIPDYVLASAENMSYVTKVVIPESVTSVGKYAFYSCDSIKVVDLPKKLEIIESHAFTDSGLQTIDFSESLTHIGAFAFWGCVSLTTVNFSPNVIDIGDHAFYGDSALTTITLPSKLKLVGGYAFYGTYISSINIPKTMTGYDFESDRSVNGPFSGALQLKEVIFEEGMTEIPAYILASKSNISYVTKVVIPESVTSVGINAFYNCDNMTIYGYKGSYAETYAITEGIPFVSVAIAKNASADAILKHMDLENLVNDVSFAGTEVSGPDVTIAGTEVSGPNMRIAGKTFSLFSVPASIDLKLSDKLQAKVDTEKKNIQVLIGFKDFSGSAMLDPSENSTAYWSESYRQVKSLYTSITGKKVDTPKLWNQFSKLRGKLKKINCSMGINASASVSGYLEFSYASGEIVFSGGGMILAADLGTSLNYKWPPCPAVYVTFEAKAGFKGQLSLIQEDTMKYTPSVNTEINLTASLGGGVGNKKIKTYAEIGMKGNLGTSVSLPAVSLSEALLIQFTADAYFDSKIFGFDGPSWGPRKFADFQLYPRPKERTMELFGGQDLAECDLSKATLSDRSYLNMPMTLGLETSEALYSRKNLYRYNIPQLVCLNDGTLFLTWIDDNGEKSGINKTSLMYAVYDGSSWSEAEKIAETGGANDYPAVWSDGQKVQIVWQKAAQMQDSATLPDLLASVELYTVTWQDGRLSEAEAVTSGNSAYEMLQSVAGNGEDKAVVWMENTANDPFQAEGTNQIKVSRYENGRWSESTVASSLTEVANLNTCYVGQDLVIVYESSSNDRNTITMIRGNEKKTFEGFSAEISGGLLYYCTDHGLMSYDIAGRMTESVLTGTMGGYTVLDDGNHKMIVSTEYNGFSSELTAHIFSHITGTWSDKIVLSDYGKYIRNYSAALNPDGNLSVALNLVDVDEQSKTIYGNAELRVMDFSDEEDLIVGESVYFGSDSLTPGEALPLIFDVTNNGTRTVSDIQVDILDSNGQALQSGTVSCAINVGETVEVSYNYRLPGTITGDVITIKAYMDHETRLSDNTVSVDIGLVDVAVGNMYLSGNSSSVSLKGEVQNIGYADASDVTVTVYNENEEGDMIGTVSLDTIQRSGARSFEIDIPEEYLDVNPLASGNVLCIVVSSSSDEMDYANNTDTYLIKSSSEEPITMNYRELTLRSGDSETLEITYSPLVDLDDQEIEWTSSDESVVTVADGRLTAMGDGEAVVTAKVNGLTAFCTVRVNSRIAAVGVYLEETSIELLAGTSKQLTAKVLPANASNQNVTWESSDNSVATVDRNGTVRAIAVGTADITVYTEDGYKTASCKVTVSQDRNTVYQITFSGGSGTSGQGPTALSGLAGTLVTLPANPYAKEGYHFIGWSDGNNTYEEGAFYRIPYRNVALEASWESDGKQGYTIQASCQTGGKITPDGKVEIEAGTDQRFTISADSGYTIGDVRVDGKSVGAVSEYTFRNVSDDHTIEALFNKTSSVIKVDKIQLSQEKASLKAGATLKLNAVVTPSTAANKQLKWSSSNVKIASVNNGLVSAISAGTATITVESQDGSNVKASCIITVTNSDPPSNPPSNPDNQGEEVPPSKGTVLTDSNTKAVYKVTSAGKSVEYKKAPGKNITSASVPATVKLGKQTYQVTSIAASAFSGCTKLKSVTIGKNVTSIGSNAFYNCTALTSITIPDKVTSIGSKAFYGCKKLKTVKGCGNVTAIGSKAFYKCEKLVRVGSKSNAVTLKKVKTIGSSAFYGCKAVKKVNLTSTALVKIGDSAFQNCTSMISFTSKSKKLTTIGKKAFYGDKKIGTLSLKTEKLKKSKVGAKAFKGIKSSCKFKVPKKKISTYKKIFKAKGAGSKFTVSKS